MRGDERTPQRLDPLGALDAWPFAVLVGIAVAVVSVGSAAIAIVDGRSLTLTSLSSAAFVASVAVLVVRAYPSRAPFTRTASAVSVALGGLGACLSLFAESGPPSPWAWGPYGLALIFVATASFRSSRSLALKGIIAASAVAIAAAAQAAIAAAPVGASAVSGLAAGTPVLAAALAGAAYARSYTRSVELWRENAAREARQFALDQHEQLAADVHQNVLGVLNREMLPFFRRLLDADAILAQDSANARDVADVVRRIILADNDRSWLDHVLVREWSSRGGGDLDPKTVIVDPGRVIDEIQGPARSALVAFVILVLRREPTPGESALHARATVVDGSRVVHLSFSAGVFAGGGRAELRPYLSVLQVAFDEVALIRAPDRLTLRLVYGHPNDR